MNALAIIFFVAVLLKLMFIGVGNWFTQMVLPGTILGVVALMILVSGGGRRALGQYLLLPPILLILLVFFFGFFSSVLNSMPAYDSVSAILRLCTMIAVSIGAFLAGAAGLGVVGHGFVFAIFFLHILAAIVLYFLGVGYEIGGTLRPTGLTGRPQLIANIASLAIVFYLCQLISGDDRKKASAILLVLMSFIFIFLSGTLKNFLTVFVVLSIALISIPSQYRGAIAVVGISALSLSGYYALAELPIGERLADALAAGVSTDVAVGDRLESSLMWRMLHWRLLLSDWFDNYFWLGAGVGQVGNLDALKTETGKGFIAHSDWIGFLVELGPFLFPLLVIAYVWIYRRIAAGHRAGLRGFFALRFSYLLLALMAVGGNVFYSAAHLYLFWLLAGLLAGEAFYFAKAPLEEYSDHTPSVGST